jgi:colicin import membrane protein
MGRFRAASLLLAALAAGLLLAACGSGGNAELLPGTTADQINANLDQVRETFNEGNCESAENAVAQVSTEVDELHKVDARLKTALKEGAAKLSEVVSPCGAAEEAEEEKAAEATEEEEQVAAEEAEAEEEAFEGEQKLEEREEKAQEKAEKKAEQPGPPEEGEESGKGKTNEGQEETVETPEEDEEVTPPAGGGAPAGGIGPGAAVEGEG